MGKQKKQQLNPFVKYTSLALQLGITIAAFTFLGKYLDERTQNKTPWFTLFGSLFGVVGGLYLALKGLIIKEDKQDD